ncbi:hypothetical protein HMPREF1548_03846 [Clostridium sp. KLE 1755]|nr:hypothetical protein HMPREF1548_03846 [Clostridium sp. KLE 1755]
MKIHSFHNVHGSSVFALIGAFAKKTAKRSIPPLENNFQIRSQADC